MCASRARWQQLFCDFRAFSTSPLKNGRQPAISTRGMRNVFCLRRGLFALATCCAVLPAAAATLSNPLLFVTQVPIPKENNGSVSNTFVSVVSLFGNHLPDSTH